MFPLEAGRLETWNLSFTALSSNFNDEIMQTEQKRVDFLLIFLAYK